MPSTVLRRTTCRATTTAAARYLGALLSVLLLLLSAGWLPRTTTVVAQVESEQVNNLRSKKLRPGIDYVPGEVLVRFRQSTAASKNSAAQVEMTLRASKGEMRVQVERFDGSELVEGLRFARVNPADTLEAIEALEARSDVLYAEPNYIRRKNALPNDARFGDSWGLKNTGQVGFNDALNQQASGVPGADIDAELAWNITTGSRSVVVGIVDEGIDINHADLRDNIWRNPGETAGDRIDNDGNGFVDDVNGWDFYHNDASVYDGSTTDAETDSHGTHVSGIVGATGNNGVGTTGVNWQVSLMSLKILGKDCEPLPRCDPPAPSSVRRTVAAYNYAAMMRRRGVNLRALNNSYGGFGRSQAELDAIRELNDLGILFVTSAGNNAEDSSRNPDYPATYDSPNIINVASTNRFDDLTLSSSFGALTVSMGAPGRGILSTTPRGFTGLGLTYTDGDNSTYSFFSGTSMAAPHVTGAAALIVAAYPNISLRNLRGVLAFSGDVNPALQAKTTTGRRLNVFNSLQSAGENDTTAPAAALNFRLAAQSGRTLTLQWSAPGDDGTAGRAADYDLVFTNSVTGVRTLLPNQVMPETAGTAQSLAVDVPIRATSGTIELITYDNAGNSSRTPLSVNIAVNSGTDPYLVAQEGVASGLSSGGAPLNLRGDDQYREGYALPFAFPFYGQSYSTLAVSTNGALYFSTPPRLASGDGSDVGVTEEFLDNHIVIAGLLDDLRTDLRAGDDVYVVTDDPERIIFRWQAMTYDTILGGASTRGEHPVNFEIELRRTGVVTVRYGDGNTRLFPLVGIGGGSPTGYPVASHTSEDFKNLTNAQIVTFTPRPAAIVAPSDNPIDTVDFFVRQQYRDFLLREPDQAGFDAWVNVLNRCGGGYPGSDPACDRILVSSSFFRSEEFQLKGFFVWRFYHVSFGRRPTYAQIIPDMQRVTAATNAEVTAARDRFTREWTERADFQARYGGTTNDVFVDRLLQTGSIQLSTRDRLVAELNATTKTRVQVLREIVESQEVNAREFNPAFVGMQYFGYLKRDPEEAGYQAWLRVINNNPNDFRTMVNGFVNSPEYRSRFGRP